MTPFEPYIILKRKKERSYSFLLQTGTLIHSASCYASNPLSPLPKMTIIDTHMRSPISGDPPLNRCYSTTPESTIRRPLFPNSHFPMIPTPQPPLPSLRGGKMAHQREGEVMYYNRQPNRTSAGRVTPPNCTSFAGTQFFLFCSTLKQRRPNYIPDSRVARFSVLFSEARTIFKGSATSTGGNPA